MFELYYQEDFANYYSLFQNGFWPRIGSFRKNALSFNPYPDIVYYKHFDYICKKNNKQQSEYLPHRDWFGLIAETIEETEYEKLNWEIRNQYNEIVENLFYKKTSNKMTSDFIEKFKKSWGEYINQYPDIPYFLYLITSHNEFGFKIGITNNPESRLKIIGTKLPFVANAIRLYPLKIQQYKIVEKFYHYLFKEKQLNGEWFDLTLADIDLMDYLFTFSFFPKGEEYFEKFAKIIEKHKWRERATEFYNSWYEQSQKQRHYMTLMNSDEYFDEIDRIAFHQKFYF